MSERKKEILNKIAAYSTGRNLSQFFGFFIAVFMRNFLGPLYMGMWSLMRVVLSYASYSELGAIQAIYYKVPLHKGKGEEEEAEAVQRTVFGFLVITSVVVSAAVLGIALFLKDSMPRELFAGFLVFPVFFIAQRIYSYYITALKANKRFGVLGQAYLLDSVVNLILVLVLVSRFKLYGLYAVSIILPVMDIFFMAFRTRHRAKAEITWGKVGSYVRFGLPVFISGFSMMLLYSVDRIMIAKWLGLVPLGFYSIAVMTRTYTQELSQNFASVLSPYFIEDYGRTGDASKTGGYVAKYTEITSCVMAVMLGAAYIVLPVFVRYLMPGFAEGIGAMKMMFLCTFFVVITSHFRNFLVMKERQVKVMAVTLSAIALNVAANYAAIKWGFGITGVAGASSLSALMMFLIMAVMALGYVKTISSAAFFVRVFAPMIYAGAVIAFIERFFDIGYSVKGAAAGLCIFAATSLVILFYVNKRTGLLNLVLDMLKERLFRGDAAEEEVTYG